MNEKTLREKAEIAHEIEKDSKPDVWRKVLLEDLADMEKELAVWRDWLTSNPGKFSPKETGESLRIARQLVNLLMGVDE